MQVLFGCWCRGEEIMIWIRVRCHVNNHINIFSHYYQRCGPGVGYGRVGWGGVACPTSHAAHALDVRDVRDVKCPRCSRCHRARIQKSPPHGWRWHGANGTAGHAKRCWRDWPRLALLTRLARGQWHSWPSMPTKCLLSLERVLL